MLLPDLLAQSAERFPEKAAIVFANEQLSFADLRRQSSQVAARLTRLGIGPGKRVAILYENAIAAVVYFWGILKAGAQAVDIPCLAGTATVNKIFAECRPAALVASERQLGRLIEHRCTLPRVVFTQENRSHVSCHSLEEITATENGQNVQTTVYDWEPAVVLYTSGTTGDPKGVMLSHRNLLSNIQAGNSVLGLSADDSILVVVPLHFIHGRLQLLTHAMIGGTLVFSAGFHFPQQVLRELVYHGVTGFSGVPYHFLTLLEKTTLATTRLPNLRYVVVTGGALSGDGLRKLSESLPGVAIHIAYGQTETSPRISSLPACDVLSKPGSCGVALPGVRIDIVGEDGVTLPPGAIGEIVVSGPNVMCGYVSGDEVMSQKLDLFGRLHTGDLGKLDSGGYLYVVGRKSELIKCAGERIFPREIEAVLEAHPAIRESGVFGLPDEILGERVVACVVVDTPTQINCDEIRRHCLQSLPLVRVPREIRFSNGLPKTGSGKIDRRMLMTHFQELALAGNSQAA